MAGGPQDELVSDSQCAGQSPEDSLAWTTAIRKNREMTWFPQWFRVPCRGLSPGTKHIHSRTCRGVTRPNPHPFGALGRSFFQGQWWMFFGAQTADGLMAFEDVSILHRLQMLGPCARTLKVTSLESLTGL